MTICKVLAEKETRNGRTITVTECADKPYFVPYYEIVESVDGIAINVTRTARTTWKKKFAEYE